MSQFQAGGLLMSCSASTSAPSDDIVSSWQNFLANLSGTMVSVAVLSHIACQSC